MDLRVFLIVVVLCLSACGRSPEDVQKEAQLQRDKEVAALVATAKVAISNQMRDPASVQWQDVQVVPADLNPAKTLAVCGQFNAKNGLGAYNGFELFAVAMTPEVRTYFLPTLAKSDDAAGSENLAEVAGGAARKSDRERALNDLNAMASQALDQQAEVEKMQGLCTIDKAAMEKLFSGRP